MPLPTSISFANYRAFRNPAALELRPLTLLYGWNSAGKSALIRLLALLGDSVSPTASGALELLGEAGAGSSFSDLRWRGSIDEGADPSIMLGFSWNAPAALSSLEYRFAYDDRRRHSIIKSFLARPREGAAVDGVYVPRPEQQARGIAVYDVEGGSERVEIGFIGLIPTPTEGLSVTKDMHELMSGLRGVVHWLRTARAAPPRRLPRSGAAPKRLQPDGRGSAEVLASDPDLTRQVSAWFEAQFARRLEIADAAPSDFRVVFRSLQRAELDVDAADAGAGFVQVLPVLVGAALAQREVASGAQQILAIEEPESNLHPNAQVSLANHLCSIAAGANSPTLVLETHSQAVLTAVQLRIARKQIARDRVVAYWVDSLADGSSELRRVEFDELGRPGPAGNWPPGVFADQRDLAYELAAEQLEREGA